jgi:transcription factor STE12
MLFPSSRHRRTHDRGDGVEGSFLSGEDEEYSGEDQLNSLEDASPTSETGYTLTSLDSVANSHHTPPSHGMMSQTSMPNSAQAYTSTPPSLGMMNQTSLSNSAQVYNSLQTLSMPMTISQPQAKDLEEMMFMKGNHQ